MPPRAWVLATYAHGKHRRRVVIITSPRGSHNLTEREQAVRGGRPCAPHRPLSFWRVLLYYPAHAIEGPADKHGRAVRWFLQVIEISQKRPRGVANPEERNLAVKGFLSRHVLPWLPMVMAMAAAVPSLALRLGAVQASAPVTALLTGAAILGAAFLLTWASEAAQRDVSQGLAVAGIALIAVLPEYAVDMYFAWTAARDPVYCHYAIANMTGSNRLLLGVGWPVIVFLWWGRTRKAELEISARRRTDLGFLTVATIYAFLLPVKKYLSVWDTLVFFAIFAAYVRRVAKEAQEEPVLVGTAKMIGELPRVARRIVAAGLYLYSAAVIVASTKPFAEALLAVGKQFGIDEFLLVQWVAPLASEAPEFAVAGLFALRLHPEMSLGTLVSSKVNQWTLLVGMLPATFCASAFAMRHMPLDPRQSEEVLLTACQSLFGLVVLGNLRLSVLEALMLLGLFAGQLFSPSVHARYVFSAAYLALACLWLLRRPHRQGIWEGFRTVFGWGPPTAAPETAEKSQ